MFRKIGATVLAAALTFTIAPAGSAQAAPMEPNQNPTRLVPIEPAPASSPKLASAKTSDANLTALGKATATGTASAGFLLPGLSRHVDQSCTGTGADGDRVQIMYVREVDMPDRYAESVALLREEAQHIDNAIALSAMKTGGGRSVRWVTNPDCKVNVLNVVLPDGAITGDLNLTEDALTEAGYFKARRKYLAFADVPTGGLGATCASAIMYRDSKQTDNLNDGRTPQLARMDRECWTTSSTHRVSYALHEMIHTFGAVQPDAPHGGTGGHCGDVYDTLCYNDGGTEMSEGCPAEHQPLLDCNDDDYFNTNPAPGTYLATHWNVANSTFLNTVPALTPPPLASITVDNPTPETGDLVTYTAHAPAGTTINWSVNDQSCRTGAPTTGPTFTILCEKTSMPTVKAAASNEGPTVGYTTKTITYAQGPHPNLVITRPATAERRATFTVSTHTENAKTPWTYKWELSSPDCTTPDPLTSETLAITCNDAMQGKTLGLRVIATRTSDGEIGINSSGVRITDVAPPTATVTGPTTLRTGESGTYTLATDTPEGTISWRTPRGWGTATNTNTFVMTVPANATNATEDVLVTVTKHGVSTLGYLRVNIVKSLAVTLTAPPTIEPGTTATITATPNIPGATITDWATDDDMCTITPGTANTAALNCDGDYTGDIAITATATFNGDTAQGRTTVNVTVAEVPEEPEPEERPTTATMSVASGNPTRFHVTVRDRQTGRGLPGRTVRLEQRAGNSPYRIIQIGRTNAAGNLTFTVTVNSGGRFRAQHVGDSTYLPVVSYDHLVLGHTKVLNQRTKKGMTATLVTASGQRIPNNTIVMQKRVVKKVVTKVKKKVTTVTTYVNVRAYRTNGAGQVVINLNPKKATFYRWVFSQTATQHGALSGDVRIP